jgi:hypothetical protein
MEPRKQVKQENSPPQKEQKPKLRIVKLEERIAPKIATNHNETLVCEHSAKPR